MQCELVLEQTVLGVWCSLLTCDCFVKDSVCVLNLTVEVSYTAIFSLFSLGITKHLEIPIGDFQDLVCAACRVRALPSWPVASVSFSSPSPLHFGFPRLWVPPFWCFCSSLPGLCSCSLHSLMFFLRRAYCCLICSYFSAASQTIWKWTDPGKIRSKSSCSKKIKERFHPLKWNNLSFDLVS